MLTLSEIDSLERQIKMAVIAAQKKKTIDFTLVEALDEGMIWPVPFDRLIPIAPTQTLDNLISRAPLVICAVASEIGFRFEGVGTVFWAKFADALGLPITMAQRQRIAAAFEAQAERYSLSRPSVSAFSSHFSIIAWPIANALLPVDLVGPVCRLIARAPVASLPGPGRTVNFASLRAWASAAEGARLTDWLRFEGPTTRVLTALLTENRGSVLSQNSYARLQDAIAVDSEAFFAARTARLRTRNNKTVAQAEQSFGRLSLTRNAGGLHFFASWPPLPPALVDEARGLARSAGWRPRLWGTGALLHPDNALGPGPFALTLGAVPDEDDPAYPRAADVFGAGGEIAAALAARSINWVAILLFEPNEERSRAEQRFSPLSGPRGVVWLAARSEMLARSTLRKLGENCGYSIYEADLAIEGDREVLVREGLLAGEARSALARHPIDAIGAGPGLVRPDRPFLLYKEGDATNGTPQTLSTGGRISAVSGAAGSPGVRAEPAMPADEGIIDLVLFERSSAFEAIAEHRLQLRVESPLPLVNVAITADLEIDGLLVARGRDQLVSLPTTVSAASPLLAPLYADAIRAKLLETGKGRLRIVVGRSAEIEIALKRAPASVDWGNLVPELVGAEMSTVLVSATARTPHRFLPATAVSTPTRGAAAFGLKLSDGRIADPLRLLTSDTFDYGDFAAHFGDDLGSRRMFDHGRGVGDIARGRVAWARALCTSLSAIAAKTRIVRQFEEPLVIDLCGRSWALSEARIKDRLTDPHEALWLEALDRGLAVLPDQAINGYSDEFGQAFAVQARVMDPGWPTANPIPVDGAMDDALNVAFSQALSALHERGLLLDVEDDFDFGSPAEDWNAAAARALKTIELPQLTKLLAPSKGARQLAERSYSDVSIAELAEDLAGWTKAWALPRGQLSPEVAASALQLWLSPAACDGVDAAVHILASDPFVARATRYAATRLNPSYTEVAQ